MLFRSTGVSRGGGMHAPLQADIHSHVQKLHCAPHLPKAH